MSERQSIRATYDSRDTGMPYHVTYRINDRTVTFQEPISDPFVNARLRVHWWDALKAFIRDRHLSVSVIVSGDVERMNDVLELDSDTLIPGSTRQTAFRSHVNETLGQPAGDPQCETPQALPVRPGSDRVRNLADRVRGDGPGAARVGDVDSGCAVSRWKVWAEPENGNPGHTLIGDYATKEEAQNAADEMYGGFDDVDYWPVQDPS